MVSISQWVGDEELYPKLLADDWYQAISVYRADIPLQNHMVGQPITDGHYIGIKTDIITAGASHSR